MNKKFDIIVYGATGFTGSLCVKYLKENYSGLTWGIAGRNQEKLENLSRNPVSYTHLTLPTNREV